MAILAEALLKANLVTKRQAREADAAIEMERAQHTCRLLTIDRRRDKLLQALREAKTTQRFRRAARALLLYWPAEAATVVRLAHDRAMKKHPDGGAKLVAELIRTREALKRPELDDAKKQRVVKQHLTRS